MAHQLLLVEDEPILRVTLADDLAEAGYEGTEAAVAAMKAGAADYLVKPFPPEELLLVLRGLLAQRTAPAVETGSAGVRQFCDLIYASDEMARVCDLVATVAGSDATVLIQ